MFLATAAISSSSLPRAPPRAPPRVLAVVLAVDCIVEQANLLQKCVAPEQLPLQYTTFQRLRLWDNVPSLPSGRPILLPESPGYVRPPGWGIVVAPSRLPAGHVFFGKVWGKPSNVTRPDRFQKTCQVLTPKWEFCRGVASVKQKGKRSDAGAQGFSSCSISWIRKGMLGSVNESSGAGTRWCLMSGGMCL